MPFLLILKIIGYLPYTSFKKIIQILDKRNLLNNGNEYYNNKLEIEDVSWLEILIGLCIVYMCFLCVLFL